MVLVRPPPAVETGSASPSTPPRTTQPWTSLREAESQHRTPADRTPRKSEPASECRSRASAAPSTRARGAHVAAVDASGVTLNEAGGGAAEPWSLRSSAAYLLCFGVAIWGGAFLLTQLAIDVLFRITPY